MQWANSGEGYTPVVHKPEEDVVDALGDDLKTVKTQIIEAAKAAGGSANQNVMAVIKEYAPSGNPNAIKDLDKAKELLDRLMNM